MMRLDLGAGDVSPPGFTPVGRDHGSEIFPLPFADESVDEIRASHVLEHFSHRHIEAVFADWVRVLKKGSRIRIAVPDFAKIAVGYLEGAQQPHEAFLLGGQLDDNDYHRALFDRERLRQLFAKNNLVLVRPWQSEIEDCANYPISLNLEGYKPVMSEIKVSGAMSVPRLGFMDNFFNCMEACLPCHVKLRKHGGAFWGQALENVFERILEEDVVDCVLAIDYDSAFLPRHLAHLMQLMTLYPEIDALAPVQSSRHLKTTLFTVQGEDGNEPAIPRTAFSGETTPVSTAHFGLTLIRADKLRALPKPWFHSTPSPAGDWHEGHIDEDISFWQKWAAAGNTLHLANRVPIGHMELMVRWPDINLEVMYQSTRDFQTKGVPEGVWE